MKKLDKCRCGSGAAYEECCGGILAGRRTARTAAEFMRSRYTAYVLKDVDYLVRTTHPSARADNLAESIRAWMRKVEWLKLHVIAVEDGTETDDVGHVEFIAEYLTATAPGRHHECSVFKKLKGVWYYVGEESEAD